MFLDKVDTISIYTGAQGYHYKFTCGKCGKKYELIVGEGRYGNIGPFKCTKCKQEYYATIDDHQDPDLYVAIAGQQPDSLLDCEGRKRSVRLPYDGLGWH